MSFILDALRKSENERQQSVVPGISDVPTVVHDARLPKWVLGVIATLSAGILVLGWAWWQNSGPPSTTIQFETLGSWLKYSRPPWRLLGNLPCYGLKLFGPGARHVRFQWCL